LFGVVAALMWLCLALDFDRDVVIEKHWRGFVNRSILDYFLEELNSATSSSSSTSSSIDIPPIITTPKFYLIYVQHNDLFFLSPVQFDVPPLLVLEFLGRIVDVFKDYFKDVSEDALKNNFVTVYCVCIATHCDTSTNMPLL
jgi:AP-3 complex subunit mu